jgi:Fic family protein
VDVTLIELIDRLDESIGAGVSPAALRNQLASLREQAEALDAHIQELEARIEQCETNPQFKNLGREQDGLEDGAKQFLKLLFSADDGVRAIAYIAEALGLSRGMADYHFDTLEKKGFVEIAGVTPDGALVILTSEGRAYVVKKLLPAN